MFPPFRGFYLWSRTERKTDTPMGGLQAIYCFSSIHFYAHCICSGDLFWHVGRVKATIARLVEKTHGVHETNCVLENLGDTGVMNLNALLDQIDTFPKPKPKQPRSRPAQKPVSKTHMTVRRDAAESKEKEATDVDEQTKRPRLHHNDSTEKKTVPEECANRPCTARFNVSPDDEDFSSDWYQFVAFSHSCLSSVMCLLFEQMHLM